MRKRKKVQALSWSEVASVNAVDACRSIEKSLGFLLRASLAQLVEQLTLNQRVVGSSPTRGMFHNGPFTRSVVCFCYIHHRPVISGNSSARTSRPAIARMTARRIRSRRGCRRMASPAV